MSVIQNIEVSVSEFFMGMCLRPLTLVQIIVMAIFWESNMKEYSVGMAKLSVEWGFLVFQVDNWGRTPHGHVPVSASVSASLF